jgi:hypothetical protein
MSSLVGRTAAGFLLSGLLVSIGTAFVVADDPAADSTRARKERGAARTVLTPEQWKQVDSAVDRGLGFLAKSQEADGSFPTSSIAQPAVTSLCIMAFLSRGHQPGRGPYGTALERAIDYVLDMQNVSSGAIMPARFIGATTNCGSYSHGISGVMLAEVYGTTNAGRHTRIGLAITKALEHTRQQQRISKVSLDEGGWRYPFRHESDLSVTSWQLMFYRAARNAEFKVPEEWVREAMNYVHRSFDVSQRSFVYGISYPQHRYFTRGMAGAGIVCLALGGEYRSETARAAGEWILQHSFEPYNNSRHEEDRYHYGAFYCSQAMFQLGGNYWDRFFPSLLRVLGAAQHQDGSWDPESIQEDQEFGSVYTTSLAVLTLEVPYQILPIYQR